MNTRIQDNNTSHGGSFLMGVITGAIGAGLALCFAPRLALEVRRRVTDSTTGLRNVECKGLQDNATGRRRAVRDDMADAVRRGAPEVGRCAREVVRGAREVEQFAMASKTDHGVARS